jgi:hypothetical protein
MHDGLGMLPQWGMTLIKSGRFCAILRSFNELRCFHTAASRPITTSSLLIARTKVSLAPRLRS